MQAKCRFSLPLQHTKDCSALERTMPRKFGSFSGIYSNPKSSTKGDVDRGGEQKEMRARARVKLRGRAWYWVLVQKQSH